MRKDQKKLILALETGISAGSLAIYNCESKSEIIGSLGKASISKAEDVLDILKSLMNQARVKGADIKTVVSGKDFGSATGLKIGEATAKGLAKSFDCSYCVYSIWDVLAATTLNDKIIKIFYLSAGKNRIVRRALTNEGFFSEIENISADLINREIDETTDNTKFFAQAIVCEILEASTKLMVENLGNNFALYLAKFASDNEERLPSFC